MSDYPTKWKADEPFVAGEQWGVVRTELRPIVIRIASCKSKKEAEAVARALNDAPIYYSETLK